MNKYKIAEYGDEEGLESETELLSDNRNPRKRSRTEHSPRKSWSLMDKRPDFEVLQEMGLGVLEVEDVEASASYASAKHITQKRKFGIENVNPNVTVPCERGSPKHKSPRAGSSKVKSPETSMAMYTAGKDPSPEPRRFDEETPLGQCVPLASLPSLARISSEKHMLARRAPSLTEATPPLADSFCSLSDEMMLSVFRWLPKRSLAHCMRVCKRWHRVCCDETLWQRLDLGNKKINSDALDKILARKASVVRLAGSEIAEWHPSTPITPSRIQYLDLSMCTVDRPTLDQLLARCPALRKLSLESVPIADSTASLVGKCSNLETLNLIMTQNISATGIGYILDGCKNLRSLNVSWCGLCERALAVLVSRVPPALQRLGLGGARHATDDMVSSLVSQCPRLLELDLSDCSRLTAGAVPALRALSRLEHLALSRCYLLPPHALTTLNSMPSLQYLDVWGMLQPASLAALRTALPAIQMNQFRFSAIARPTVGTRRTSIWGLRTRD